MNSSKNEQPSLNKKKYCFLNKKFYFCLFPRVSLILQLSICTNRNTSLCTITVKLFLHFSILLLLPKIKHIYSDVSHTNSAVHLFQKMRKFHMFQFSTNTGKKCDSSAYFMGSNVKDAESGNLQWLLAHSLGSLCVWALLLII